MHMDPHSPLFDAISEGVCYLLLYFMYILCLEIVELYV